MGIKVEFNPNLALRSYDNFLSGKREEAECLPEDMTEGQEYNFLKKGQRAYYISNNEFWDYGEIPLIETKGNEVLKRPVAGVKIIEATHFLKNGEVWTKGIYKVIEIFKDDEIYFEACKRINK